MQVNAPLVLWNDQCVENINKGDGKQAINDSVETS
jgi:hypothetical protein